MPMKRILCGLGLVPLLIVTGCSGRGAPPQPAALSTTATTTPASSPLHPEPLGSTYTLTDPGLKVSVTVYDVAQNFLADGAAPSGGGHWTGIDVQTCLDEAHTAFTVSWTDWSVADADNGQYEVSQDQVPNVTPPIFPVSPTPLAVGECARGWVAFPVAFGARITTVKYKPTGRPPVFWSADDSDH